ncbi:MAG: hypothetical protein JWO36_3142, partial [Myxococcales bacterium]|nr:hypothetical protein [Myxococcales bacterium]
MKLVSYAPRIYKLRAYGMHEAAPAANARVS